MEEYLNAWMSREFHKQRERTKGENQFLSLSEFSSSVGLQDKQILEYCKNCQLLFIEERGVIWLPTCQLIRGKLNDVMMKSIERLASKFNAIDMLTFFTFQPLEGFLLHAFLPSESTIKRCKTADDIINVAQKVEKLNVVFHGSLIQAIEQDNRDAIEAIIQEFLTDRQHKVKTTVVHIQL
ncbi:hypothetical protein [Vibrio agarivorans]|uniref:Uncharacterized protein n=1 Tax=Vibrio agarivorans TaxID=153622 RepID=A0ABT7Y0W7_9VIBR|nr:hypothetical protein [Vibrio agarivorans]MDN2481675.1 hypothetical protein [Vibrio agarivorans]